MRWMGPIQVGNTPSDQKMLPPESPGVYVISEQKWTGAPSEDARVRYVGKASNLRFRLGQSIAVLLGFGPPTAGPNRYFHGRSRRLFDDRKPSGYDSNITATRKLFIGWHVLTDGECIDCIERQVFEEFEKTGLLSFARKPRCSRPRHPDRESR